MSEPTATTWNSRPLFVSSTFADMHDERDFLRVHAFDWLEKEKLKERRHYLETIDLRQGLETSDEGDDTERELKVLRVCLDEIKRSRPFFIGILGDRYGWDPPEERMEAAANAAGFSCDVTGKKSVTELEILYGVLENPNQCKRSWFYLREMDYTGMPDEVRKRFDDRFAGDTEKADKLDALKERIKKELPDHVRTYQAKWDTTQKKVVGLDDLVTMVREDLWTALDPETKEWLLDAPKTWQAADARMLDDFVLDRLRIVDGEIKGFVERDEVTRPLIEHALSPAAEGANWGICLTGEAGSGKSSLFARVYRELHQMQQDRKSENLFLLAHVAGIYPSSGSVDTLLRRWIHELAEFLKIDDPLDAAEEQGGSASSDLPSLDSPLDRSINQSSAEEIEETFASLLGRASRKSRIVLLLDALNQFDRSTRARYLTWLPKIWPENARFIATAIPGTESETLDNKSGVEVKAMEQMTSDEARQVAHQFYKERFHREPNVRALDILLEKRLDKDDPESSPACGNPLWLELALQEMNLLEADDYKKAEEDFPKLDGAKRSEALQMREAKNLPPDPAGVYGELLDRAGCDFGKTWTRTLMSLIALGRAGWRESDLRVLVPEVLKANGGGKGKWDELAFAGVRRTLGSHLVQRGAQKQWDAFHAQLRERILEKDLADETERQRFHGLISDHLEGLPENDPLRNSETMVHLIGLGDQTRAARYIARFEASDAERDPAATILAQHAAGSAEGLDFMAGLPSSEGLSDYEIPLTVVYLLFEGLDALERETGLALCLTLLDACRTTLKRLAQSDSSNVVWQSTLSMSYITIGTFFQKQGNLGEALSAYRQSMEIRERLAQSDPSNIGWQSDLSKSHWAVGMVLQGQGNLEEALSAYRQSIEIRERLLRSEPSNMDWQGDLSVIQEKIGLVFQKQGNLGEALSAYRQSMEIRECLAQSDSSNTEWQLFLSVSQGNIGIVLSKQGNLEEALSAHRQSKEIRERLVQSDPSNANWQHALSVSQENIGDVLSNQGNLDEALSAYHQSKKIRERLAESDPSNADWQRDLSVIHVCVGSVSQKQGNLGEALTAYRQFAACMKSLAQSDSSNTGWQNDLGTSHLAVGMVLQKQGNLSEALSAYRQSMEIRERLAQSDPSNAGWQVGLAEIHKSLGELEARRGRIREVLEHQRAWQEILEDLQKMGVDTGSSGRMLTEQRKQVRVVGIGCAGLIIVFAGCWAWLGFLKAIGILVGLLAVVSVWVIIRIRRRKGNCYGHIKSEGSVNKNRQNDHFHKI